MPAIVRDGLRLHYRVAGTGPPVLFAHGMTGSGDADWADLAGHLAARFRCVVPDLRGHAGSEFRADGFGYDAIRDDLLALVEHEGLQRPHLVGFSMGAEVLLDAELTRPGTAASMVLLGICTGPPPGHVPRDGRPLRRPARWPGPLREAHAPRHGPDHWWRLAELVTLDWQRRTAFTDEQLASVGCPVLVVNGAGELAFKLDQGRRFADLNPNVRLVELPGAGHAVHVERRDAVRALVADFLR